MNSSTAQAKTPRKKARKRDRTILFAGVAAMGAGQSFMFIIAGLLARDIGLSESLFGLALSIGNISLIVLSPYWGHKTDTIGRRPIFLIGIGGIAIGNLLLAVVLQLGLTGILTASTVFVLLVAARSVYAGMSTAIYPAAYAYMADITARERRAKGVAFVGGANSLGIVAGPAVGGSLALIAALLPMYVLATLALGIAIAAALVLRETSHNTANAEMAQLKYSDRRIRAYLILRFGFWLVFNAFQVVLAFYVGDQLNLTQSSKIIQLASVAMLCQAAIAFAIQIFVLQFFEVSQKLLLRLFLPAFTVGLLIMSFANTFSVIVGASLVLGISLGLSHAATGGAASLSVENHEQGSVAGLVSAVTTIGVVIGPVFGTALYDIDANLFWFSGAAITLALSIYALKVSARSPRHA